ncbi:nitroreductase family protein [Hoyosella subflava]|uniref:Nitroreductase n=1 Tax=Hoyosella subflava (strain DSM 45089 / JCM 17490 / NBRC 109087 / DQS3-9A1) TaxID=443218 RepID=F6ENB9_HOYSD|nr:hypothetical protein [Hoyosella subflava]AEF40390.1 hypothetical protein AS9A_1941 [Hoyosella subflava DQS3-9A1]
MSTPPSTPSYSPVEKVLNAAAGKSETPDFAVVREALNRARRAPSVWNRQPWQWRYDGDRLHLFADPERMSGVVDPDSRLLLVSCGTALHHGIIAMKGLGWDSTVSRFPVPGNHLLVASIKLSRSTGENGDELAMFLALDSRRTETRPLASLGPLSPVPRQLARFVEQRGVALTVLDSQGIDSIASAARLPTRSARLSKWGLEPDFADVCVLTTAEDTPEAWLHAGEALSAALLLATSLNVATCPVVDIEERAMISAEADRCGRQQHHQHQVASAPKYAQAVVRIGLRRYPALRRSHRRNVRDVLQYR